MTTAQLKQPFVIYEKNVGTYLPYTPASSMLQLLSDCSDHPVSNKEVCELLNVNHSSASKLLKKLRGAGLVQHSELQEDDGPVELTDHGRKFLRDLELAMRTIAATTQVQENSSPELRRPEESKSEQLSTASSPIHLDELESGIGTLISKLHVKPAGRPEKPKSELPPKRLPMRASGRRRHDHVDLEGQLSLSLDSFAA